jgi:hypothetical protein
MKYSTAIAALVVLFAASADAQQNPMPDEQALTVQGAELATQFVGTLLPTLQQAMQTGGPVNGIDVCAVQAPAIAQALSDQSGWQVKRVSLKARNSTVAVPDDMATGYLTGQIRGAISLRAPANER